MTERPNTPSVERIYAPTAFEQAANEQAARIAAREANAFWVRTGCQATAAALEAWRQGERSWPWPDGEPADVRGLLPGLLSDRELHFLSNGQRQFNRSMRHGR